MTTAQSISASELEKKIPKMQKTRDEALSYLALSQRALAPKSAMVVAIGGFSGSGKSTIARELTTKLCPLPGALLLNSNAERKAEFDVMSTQRLELEHYTTSNANRVYDRLAGRTNRTMESEYPVIVDATFLSSVRRNKLEQLVSEKHVEFHGFWLLAPVEVMRHRIQSRRGDVSDADVMVLEKQLKQKKGEITWHHIDTDSPVDDIVQKILKTISLTRSVSTSEAGKPEHA